MTIIINILLLLLVISVLTFIHELGHFIAARIVKAKVLEFSIGFGPKIFSKKKRGIEYNFRALPFGGFVKILGDGDPSNEEEDSKDSGNLKNKSKLAQVFVMLAGVTMNVILAFAFYFIFLSGSGWKVEIGSEYADFNPVGATITKERVSDLPYELTQDTPARESGLYENGYIKSVNGEPVDNYKDFKGKLDGITSMEVILEACKYESEECNTFTVPVNQDGKIGMYIGDNYSVYIDYSGNKLLSGFSHSVNVLKLTGEVLGGLFAQAKETGDYSPLSNTVSGPIGIYFVIDYFKDLGIFVFLGVVADLSLSLAVINLFPIPALDGGRAFILLIEGVLRKDLPEKIESWMINISFIFLILLIVGIMFKDILNIDELQSWFR
jgi:regulator of sigma E protease